MFIGSGSRKRLTLSAASSTRLDSHGTAHARRGRSRDAGDNGSASVAKITRDRVERMAKARACENCGECSYERLKAKAARAPRAWSCPWRGPPSRRAVCAVWSGSWDQLGGRDRHRTERMGHGARGGHTVTPVRSSSARNRRGKHDLAPKALDRYLVGELLRYDLYHNPRSAAPGWYRQHSQRRLVRTQPICRFTCDLTGI